MFACNKLRCLQELRNQLEFINIRFYWGSHLLAVNSIPPRKDENPFKNTPFRVKILEELKRFWGSKEIPEEENPEKKNPSSTNDVPAGKWQTAKGEEASTRCHASFLPSPLVNFAAETAF